MISLAFCQNSSNLSYKNFDKTQVKLFPDFTRHHFITCTKLSAFIQNHITKNIYIFTKQVCISEHFFTSNNSIIFFAQRINKRSADMFRTTRAAHHEINPLAIALAVLVRNGQRGCGGSSSRNSQAIIVLCMKIFGIAFFVLMVQAQF